MKNKNSCTMLREERDYALFTAYLDAIKINSFKSLKDAVNYIRFSPAPKWFTSPDRCATEISRMIRGMKPYVTGYCRLKKYSDLLKLYKEACASEENALCSHYAICEKIVETPAPQWYLGYKQAFDIIMREMRNHNERMAKRYAK